MAGTKERKGSETTRSLMHSKKHTMTKIQTIIMAILSTFALASCSDYLTTATAEAESEVSYTTFSDVIYVETIVRDTIVLKEEIIIKEEVPVAFDGLFQGGLYITGSGEGVIPEFVVEDNVHIATNYLKVNFEAKLWHLRRWR